MALSNESDERARDRSIQTKEEAMDAWQYWLSWGENDKVGAHLIDQIARFGLGDAEIIEFLEARTTSGIPLIHLLHLGRYPVWLIKAMSKPWRLNGDVSNTSVIAWLPNVVPKPSGGKSGIKNRPMPQGYR